MILPPVPHWPGRNARPPEALFAPLKATVAPGMDAAALAGSDAFSQGLRAFRAGYFWEAHELWEAVWTCLPPAAAQRLAMRGLIQLANAGLKARMGQNGAAARILALADAALDEAARRGADCAMGLTRAKVDELRAQATGDSP